MENFIEADENSFNRGNLKTAPTLQGSFFPSKKCAESKESKSGSRFGRLLSDVTNELIVESDEKFAMQSQVDEAYDIANDWIREERDRKIAEKVSYELQEGEKKKKMSELAMGECEALNIAMDERRRVLAEEKQRRLIEAADSEACKKIVIDEIEEEHRFKTICAKDEHYAKEVYDLMQDELLAESFQSREEREHRERVEELNALMKADEKVAMDHHDLLSKEWKGMSDKQSEEDYQLALKHQATLDERNRKLKLRQEEADRVLSKKIATKAAREEHRRQKRIFWITSDKYLPFADASTIARQWEDAEVEAEDVEDGICITVILPHLRELRVKTAPKNTICIDAARMVAVSERSATESNSQYLAEFEIDGGSNVKLTDEDLSYEYCSETGLLHIYIEKIRLVVEEEVDAKQSKPSVLSNFKNSFKRLLGRA